MNPGDVNPGDVWAPDATRVALVVRGDSGRNWSRMTRTHDGWWHPDTPLLAGIDYWLSVDGSEPIADPRATWLPEGPNGPARVLQRQPYEWATTDFVAAPWHEAICYELHIGTFSHEGTFTGAIEHLDHLAELGVTHVELMPVNTWDGEFGWGYDGVAWWAPHAPCGTPAELMALVDACHERGLAVVLDVVFNHLGPSGAVLDRFGPYTHDSATPWGRALNFDQSDCEEVRRFIIDCAEHWIRVYRFDGLRLDAVHALVDESPRHVVAELADRVAARAAEYGRQCVVVAEWDRHDPTPVVAAKAGGWGLDAHWADDLHHGLHVALTGETHGYYADAAASPDPVIEALRDVYIPRRATGDPATETPVGAMDRSRFIVCSQNHDQVGNRAAGERLEHLVGSRPALAAATLALLGPSVPLLFQGQEWAASAPFPFFADHRSTGLGEQVVAGRRDEFPDHPWDDVADPCDPATFASAKLDWDELATGSHAETLDWYRRLIALRRNNAEFAAGAPCEVTRLAGTSVIQMRRGRWVVTVDLRPDTLELPEVAVETSTEPAMECAR